MARYAAVSGSLAGAGFGLVRARKDRQDRAAVLRAALGGLKGPLMKIAQILGTIPDLVPPEYTEAFAGLQANAPPMGPNFVRRRLAGELGPEWAARFKDFSLEASFAASLGQVHRATSRGGEALACKLQYPDMASVVEADLRQLKLILAIYEKIDRALSTERVQAEIADRLREELDYEREAKHIRLFGKILAAEPDLQVPKLFEKLSTPRLLTMSWMEGESFLAAAKGRSLARRNRIALHLYKAWYKPFYGYGVIHGDPHPGNYTVRVDDGLNLLDFGCVRLFAPSLVEGGIHIYEALRDGREEQAVEAYRAFGFVNPTRELVSVLNLWSRFIYAPVLEDKARPLSETNTGVYGKELARKIHAALREQGGVVVPREFVFLDRAAVGLGSVFLRLGAEVNWHRVFNEMIQSFSASEVKKRQKTLLQEVGLTG